MTQEYRERLESPELQELLEPQVILEPLGHPDRMVLKEMLEHKEHQVSKELLENAVSLEHPEEMV